jgi:hypothetical protein
MEIKVENKEEKSDVNLDEKAIAKVEKSIEEMEKELDGKLYTITKEEKVREYIEKFVNEDAKWTGLESAGVKELSEMIAKNKRSEIKLDGTAVQALYWFLKQHTGTGLESAKHFISMMKPVSEALSRMQGDKNAFDALQFELAQLKNPQENADITADEQAAGV